ncbi:hypothetical protein PIB30_011291 [Stylosanthes scabra]|uniref:Uncharacterized protein n=1 Tax=Stylosanthes scabra TaxID=79078 RepID=A0ABU6V8C1_9FABA|nr:hypothetical protein [Stylosanthes scabra]
MLEDLRAMEPRDDLENLETPVKEETEEPKTPRKRLYKWATEGEEDIMYEFLFKFMTGKTFEAVREHFMSLAKEAEMDLASNILDQMMVYAGAETMFPGPITTQVASHSLLPKYIRVPKQTNQ